MAKSENNDAKNDLKEKLLRPASLGEYIQASKIKKLSNDAEEISEYKKKLQETQKKLLAKKKQDDEIGSDGQISENISAKAASLQSTPNRRRYDRHVRKVYSKSEENVFQLLLNSFSAVKKFKFKYKSPKLVKFSLWNLFTNGSLFYPDESVVRFVEKYIIPVQILLRHFLQKLKNLGWLDEIGKPALSALEYNLITECQRLMNELYTEDFIFKRRSPQKALESLNYFIGYYYAILYSKQNVDLLTNGIKKMNEIMERTEEKKNKTQGQDIDKIMVILRNFFNGDIESNFIQPLLESYYSRPLYSARTFITVEPVSEDKYYADEKLSAEMKAKEEQYRQYLFRKKELLEFKIRAISQIKMDLIYRENDNAIGLRLTDWALLTENPSILESQDFSKIPLHKKPYYLALFFIHNYADILTQELDLRVSHLENKMVKVILFQENLFQNEINFIKENLQFLKYISSIRYEVNIFNVHVNELSQELGYHLNNLNFVADKFYHIGIKLLEYSFGSNHAAASTPLSQPDLGKNRLPCEDYIIYGLVNDSKIQYSHLFLKTIKSTLQEIRSFCFQYSYYLEHQYRIFPKDNPLREMTLRNFIDSESQLTDLLKKIESGEDIDN